MTCSPLVSTGAPPPGLPRKLAASGPPVSCHQDRGVKRQPAMEAAGQRSRRLQAEACQVAAHPAFAGRSAEALLREAGAVCRSALVPAPFPQARSPFGVFPSSTAAPRHRGPLPSRHSWRRCRSDRACLRLAPHPGRAFATSSPRVPRALLRERVRCDVNAVAPPSPDTPMGFSRSSQSSRHMHPQPASPSAACRRSANRSPHDPRRCTAAPLALLHVYVRACRTPRSEAGP
jgi:hypothetical protein